ncbi:helix-turn-helix domain-containing protein [Paraburkholderia phenoliruptrix]|uniref:helix-turn-helix domain-containing protein n=1 Tax=Paraburkholderia phenoliruptrix TaxID=252970 RepID=UPI003CC5C67E
MIQHLRVEAARLMLEQGRLSLDVIADQVGLNNRERMRRAFLRTVGQPPEAVRRLSRETRGALGQRPG